jgi:flavin-dependent dehydrogenase
MKCMADHFGQHAVIIGGSIAGLMTARVLSDYFAQVTVLERDQIEDRPVIHKSVP